MSVMEISTNTKNYIKQTIISKYISEKAEITEIISLKPTICLDTKKEKRATQQLMEQISRHNVSKKKYLKLNNNKIIIHKDLSGKIEELDGNL